MAATRLIALHINKGKTIAQTLADRTDYSKNEEKTEGGKYISSYECDARTADEQFLLSKRQYEHMKSGPSRRISPTGSSMRGRMTPSSAGRTSTGRRRSSGRGPGGQRGHHRSIR